MIVSQRSIVKSTAANPYLSNTLLLELLVSRASLLLGSFLPDKFRAEYLLKFSITLLLTLPPSIEFLTFPFNLIGENLPNPWLHFSLKGRKLVGLFLINSMALA